MLPDVPICLMPGPLTPSSREALRWNVFDFSCNLLALEHYTCFFLHSAHPWTFHVVNPLHQILPWRVVMWSSELPSFGSISKRMTLRWSSWFRKLCLSALFVSCIFRLSYCFWLGHWKHFFAGHVQQDLFFTCCKLQLLSDTHFPTAAHRNLSQF